MEERLDLVVGLVLESHDLLLPFDHKPERDRLHASGRELRLDLSPQDRGKLESDKPVQNPARLLGVDKIHVDGTRIPDGVHDRVLCYLMKDDSPCLCLFQPESFVEMPGDGLSLPVLIGRKPHCGNAFRRLLQFGHHLLLVRGYHIFRSEVVLHIHAQLLVLKIPDVTETGFHHIAVSQEFLYSLGFGRRLDDN